MARRWKHATPWLALVALAVSVVVLALALRGRGAREVAPLVPRALDASIAEASDPAPTTLQRAERDSGSSRSAEASSASRVAATGFADGTQWIEGRVVFPPGTPLDERLVVVARSSRRFEGRKGPDARNARVEVDAHGRFRAPFSSSSRSGSLSIEGRYLHLPAPLELEQLDVARDVRLEPELGGRLCLRLLPPDARGFEPGDLAGARVHAYASGDEGRASVERVAAFAADGCATFDALLVRASWNASFELPGLLDDQREGIELHAGQVTELELDARRGVRVTGRVVDEHGRALAKAHLLAASDADNGRFARVPALTDDAGNFELRGIVPGEISLEARQSGRVTATANLGARVEGERVVDVELTLTSGLALAGVVRWPDGTPVEGAVVHVHGVDELPSLDDLLGERRVVTGADGRFHVAGFGAVKLTVRASAHRAQPGARRRELASAPLARAELVGLAAGTLDVELELSAGHGLRGRVVDERGEPVPRFRIRAQPTDLVLALGPGASVTRNFERDDGRFELEGLLETGHRLTATAAGLLDSEPHEHGPHAAGELVLVLFRPASIEGTVLDPHGAPVPGARVEFRGRRGVVGARSDFAGHSLLSGADAVETSRAGGFRQRQVRPGRVKVVATSDGFGASEPLALELEPGEERTGIVLHLRAP